MQTDASGRLQASSHPGQQLTPHTRWRAPYRHGQRHAAREGSSTDTTPESAGRLALTWQDVNYGPGSQFRIFAY